MIAKVRCEKCGAEGKFDVGEDVETVEEAQAKLDEAGVTSCPFGNHVELSPIDYKVLEVVEGSAPSEEEWLAEMRVENDLWTTEELVESEIEITGFSFGIPQANIREERVPLFFESSPEGNRYYHLPKGLYAEMTEEQATEKA